MARDRQDRRKRLMINKPLQGRLMAKMTLLPGVVLAGIAVFTAVYVTRAMNHATATGSELPDLMPLFYLVIVFQLLAAVFLLANSLKASHLVAGPAYRICKSLERIRSGDLAFEVKLRKGDHLTEIRDELNLLIDWLNANPPMGSATRQQAAETSRAEPDPALATHTGSPRLPLHNRDPQPDQPTVADPMVTGRTPSAPDPD